jgi:hypothetical protein
MHIPITPLTIVAAILTGALGAYLAHRRGHNPYIWFCIGSFFGILGAFAIFFAPARKKVLTKSEPEPPVQQLLPGIQGPSDKFWYYLNQEHKQVGPMSLDGLTNAWRQGKISLTTYVWNEELPDWKPLRELQVSNCKNP